MTTDTRLEIKVDLIKNVPFLLDAILEIGLGFFMVSRPNPDTILLTVGWILIIIGGIQLIRKIKTFHLTNTELLIKRPLFPFSIAEHRFEISEIKEIRFVNIIGRPGGPHLNIVTGDRAESYRIETTKENIDKFEINLRALGLIPTRERM